MNTIDSFQKNGYVILKDFFNDNEVEQVKIGAQKSVKENLKGDLICNEYLRDLTVLNPKIVEVVRQLVGGEPVYIGDSNISHNDRAMSLHKDNPDRFNPAAPDWLSNYTVLRMGVYLQDYTHVSGGLILREKSHQTISRWKGKIINVRSTPRDLVIWNLRTTHSGNAKRLKIAPGLDINPYLCKLLPNFLFIEPPAERIALFLSYGKDDKHLDRYIKYLKTRKYAVDRWRKIVITPDLIRKGEAVGVAVKDLSNDAKAISDASLSEGHVELAVQ